MKILIFIEGNILDQKFEPIKSSIKKIQTWIENGAEVEYITMNSGFVELKKMTDKLKELGLSAEKIHAKQNNEKYTEIVENEAANILIENQDNCENDKCVGERLDEELKVKSIILDKDFGIDHLPDSLDELKAFNEENI